LIRIKRRTRRETRAELFKRFDGRCFYCARITVFEHAGNSPDSATIEHVQSRALFGANRNERWTVLACRACNQRRNMEDQAAVRWADRLQEARRHRQSIEFMRGWNRIIRE
jgi:5-methylcytosine-specific restriction endonuclease McrA